MEENEIKKELQKLEEEQLKRNKLREKMLESLSVKILKKGKSKSNGDIYAYVEITDKETGETKKFNCRNVFDVGYVINPLYEIAPNVEGAIVNRNMWQTFYDNKGWIDVRELTETEKKMIKYLINFPPVDENIRM